MHAEEAVRSVLLDDGTVAGLVGTRIYPMLLPQAPTLPAIVYTRISGYRIHDLAGPSGMAGPRIQLDLWAATYSGVKALAEAVRQALDGYSGTVDGALRVGGISIDSELDMYEPGVAEFRVVQDYIIWHDET